jgi:hypothetical protein
MIIKHLKASLFTGLVLAFTSFSAQAVLLSVSGPDSTVGLAPQIIAAPANTSNNATPFSRQVGFDEKQGVLLGAPLRVDGGSIAAGQLVNSHMIYLERFRDPNSPRSVWHLGVDWTFDGPILGVISSQNGGREAASESILGLDTTTYAQFNNRGMEANDSYRISDTTLRVNMKVTEPGDWIRVVTLARPVPETGGLGFGVIGVLAVAGLRRRLRRTAA